MAPNVPEDHPTLGASKTSKIPNARKPKTRNPRGWRDKVIFPGRALPTYTGPYPVGTMEIEVPAKAPRTFSHIKRRGKHMLQLETVLMTIYFPTKLGEYNLQSHESGVSRQLWLGRPRMSIAEGYGHFAGVGKLGIPVFLPAMFTKLPAYRNAPIASHWASPVTTEKGGKNPTREMETRPEGAPEEPAFPLMLFSHGLGGTRTMYSSVCGEFASYGFVVVAVEHRDGSGPRTYVNHAESGPGSVEDLEARAGVDHWAHEKENGYDVVDYLFPLDNAQDTAPHNDKGVDTELRNAQTALRVAEMHEAYQVVCEIVAGEGDRVAKRNFRREGFKASSSHGLEGVDWSRWTNRVRLDHVTACGHSFGAATVVEILRHDYQFNYVSQGIIYDIWGAGTKLPEDDSPEHRIHVPLLAINSEAFTYWPSNFELVKTLIEEAQSGPFSSPAWLMTLRGTVHISQSDFSLLYPVACSLFLKMVANPRRALDLNINASLEFLSHVLPADLARVNRAYQNEGLLENDISLLNRIPSTQIHKPNDQWIAMRLQIRHEWLYRLSPKLFRVIHRHVNERRGKPPETGDETWLHAKPSQELIDRHLQRIEAEHHVRKAKNDDAAPMSKETSYECPVVDIPTRGEL